MPPTPGEGPRLGHRVPSRPEAAVLTYVSWFMAITGGCRVTEGASKGPARQIHGSAGGYPAYIAQNKEKLTQQNANPADRTDRTNTHPLPPPCGTLLLLAGQPSALKAPLPLLPSRLNILTSVFCFAFSVLIPEYTSR